MGPEDWVRLNYQRMIDPASQGCVQMLGRLRVHLEVGFEDLSVVYFPCWYRKTEYWDLARDMMSVLAVAVGAVAEAVSVAGARK